MATPTQNTTSATLPKPLRSLDTPTSGRTAHLLALMKKGDDAFNARDLAGMDAVHHPSMIAYVTGNAEPIYGRAAHAAAMKQFFGLFPDKVNAPHFFTSTTGSTAPSCSSLSCVATPSTGS